MGSDLNAASRPRAMARTIKTTFVRIAAKFWVNDDPKPLEIEMEGSVAIIGVVHDLLRLYAAEGEPGVKKLAATLKGLDPERVRITGWQPD